MSVPGRRQVDVRAPRFAAWVTTLVLATVLVTRSWELAAAQTVVFGLGALAGLRFAPYGAFFRHVVRRFVGPPTELEDESPVRFAQALGFVFAAIATVGYGVGSVGLGAVAAGMALAAALLNAAFGLCLGCIIYLRFRKVVGPGGSPRQESAPAGFSRSQ